MVRHQLVNRLKVDRKNITFVSDGLQALATIKQNLNTHVAFKQRYEDDELRKGQNNNG
jgi:hypothetical protein